jgi:hypothetical protein
MNRHERRKAARKPLGANRLGVPIFTTVLQIGADGSGGFYWIAGEDPNFQDTVSVGVEADGIRLSGAVIAADGPFDTAKEASAAAQLAVAGKDCVVEDAGAWNPAWEKPQ